MWRLYVIVDLAAVGARSPKEVSAAAIRGGADVIQLRDKQGSDESFEAAAREVLTVTRQAGVPLILNDRVAIAKRLAVEGVHVGQDDWAVARVRQALGPGMLIGKSTHSLEQALAAQAEGASYIGFGPLFSTPTKPGSPSIGLSLIRQAVEQVHIPIVCIGGIDATNLEAVLQAGARCVAVVRAVCAAKDPEAAARQLKDALIQFDRAIADKRL